ncbi:hypothetical protein CC2G_001714 [Coprinopsis cinerea AmutBmut pab1-1]|nr:hypothetical protein CC2G_001714 [Coprinopsis cinerea AmutBmut pab1-1]
MAPIRTKAAALQTPPQAHYSNATNAGQAPAIPSIRLISATPSATGMSSSEGTTSNTSMSLLDGPTNTNGRPVMPWDLDPPPLPTSTQTSATLAKSISNSTSASNSGTKKLRTVRSVLKPKVNDENAGVGVQGSAKKVVVPKKSKLGLLGTLGGKDRERERGKDLSDVVRRVGVGKLDGSTRLATVSLNNGSSVTLERGPSSATAPNAPSLPRASTTATMKKTPAGTVSRRAADGKASSAKLKAGFEIYVDPSFEDEEIGEIVVVKKKKSRAGLDGVGWGAPPAGADKPVPPVPRSTLGERNMNIPAAGGEDGMLKVKEDERKWWSIGRGRKDSKEDKKKDNEKATIAPRSQTPEPFGGFNSSNTSPQKAEGRGRFNSLDAGIFLGLTSKKSTANFNPSSSPTTTAETPTIRINDLPEREAPASIGRERSKSVTLGGLLAVPGSTGSVRGANTNASNTGSVRSLGGQGQAGSVSAVPPSVARSMSTGSGSGSGGLAVPVDPHMPSGGASGGGGSIALRAMRSVKSLARIGSWAQLGSGGGEGVSVRGGSKLRGELDPSLFVAPDDAGTTTATSNANANANGAKKEKRKSKKETKEEKRERKEREKEEKMREKESRERALSTSSFEAGALSSYGASPAPVRCATSLGFNGSPASYGSVRGTSPTAYASIRERAQSSLGFHVNGGGVDDGGVSPTSTLGFATAGSPRGYTITDSNAPIGYDANTGSLTVGKVKGKKKKAYLAGGAGAGVGTGETTTIGKSATIGRSTGKDTIGKASSNNKDKDTIGKKKSILGLGLPSSIRLPSLGNRQGSSASSVVSNPGMQFGGMVVPPAAGRLSVEGGRASVDANGRLSVEGLGAVGVERRASVQSTASSLRPVSVASSYGSRVSSFGASSVADSRLSAVDSTGRLSAVSGVDSTGRLSVASGVDSTGRLSVDSRATKLSTGAGSVRWSEGVLEREKEKEERRRESLEAAQHANASYSVLEEREGYAVVDRKDGSGVGVGGGKRESLESRRESRESRRSSEGRRRAALTDVFPEVESQIRAGSSRRSSASGLDSKRSSAQHQFRYPILTIEEATNDGHGFVDGPVYDSEDDVRRRYRYSDDTEARRKWRYADEDDEVYEEETSKDSAATATPVKKARPRPKSEQLLGRSRTLGRPKGVYEDEDGVLSVLSAATNDLEKLINNLDLEATPATPDMTPLKPSASPFSSEPSSARTSIFESNSKPKPKSTSQKIKEMCNASPTAKKSIGASSILSTGTLGAGGVKAIVAKLNAEQQQQQQLAQGTIRKSSTSSLLSARSSMSSLTSLRPYAQSRSRVCGGEKEKEREVKGSLGPVEERTLEDSMVTSDASMKALAGSTKATTPTASTFTIPSMGSMSPETSRSPSFFVKTHRRTMTPAPEPEPAPVFQPLRPAPVAGRKVSGASTTSAAAAASATKSSAATATLASSATATANDRLSVRPLEIKKHKLSRESPIRVKDAFCDDSGSEDEEKFRTVRGLGAGMGTVKGLNITKRASTASSIGLFAPTTDANGKRLSTSSRLTFDDKRDDQVEEGRVPITREARRILGMSGTMGGSDVSAYQVEIDESDPDSDVPEELRYILRKDRIGAKEQQPSSWRNGQVFVDPEDEEEEDVMDDDVVLKDGKPLRYESDEEDEDENGRLEVTEDMTMDIVEVGRNAPVQPRGVSPLFDVFPVPPTVTSNVKKLNIDTSLAVSSLGAVPMHDADVPTSAALGNSLSSVLGSSAASAATAEIHQASRERLPVFKAQLVSDSSGLPTPPPSAFQFNTNHILDENYLNASYSSSSSDGHCGINDNDTKRSFDFTGELAKLNESGASDRRSFVEQLESAFKTPAKLGSELFKIGFGIDVDVPPVPSLPAKREEESVEESMEEDDDEEESVEQEVSGVTPVGGVSGFLADGEDESRSRARLSVSDLGPIPVDLSATSNSSLEVPDLHSKDSLFSVRSKASAQSKMSTSASSKRSTASRVSDGELNRSFRFGGVSSASPSPVKGDEEKEEEQVPRTLSDIIPPPSHVREISFSSSWLDQHEDSALRSILAKVPDAPDRVDEDESDFATGQPIPRPAKPEMEGNNNRESKRISFVPLTRPSSGISFAGMDSFDEVRRGFEFHDYRPAFYPPPPAMPTGGPSAYRYGHRKAQESVWSIASVSSYGRVLRDGAPDPFDYGMPPPLPPLPPMPSLRESTRETQSYPMSDDDSMDAQFLAYTQVNPDMHPGMLRDDESDRTFDCSVDDTFHNIRNRNIGGLRKRVDSDASSFYFRNHHQGHRRRESNFSVSSISAPPVSMFTRGHHRRTSSVTSASSVALSYMHHGAMGGRAIMARHRRESSMDSMMSEHGGYSRDSMGSFRNMARPGLGDKMFETAGGYLDAIAGSPSGSISGSDLGHLSAPGVGDRTSGSSYDYYDSIMDGDDDGRRVTVSSYEYSEERPTSSLMEDSLFDKTGVEKSEMSSGCVFEDSRVYPKEAGYRPVYRRLSEIYDFGSTDGDSTKSRISIVNPDDTMITMIGGGHVRRQSVGSAFNASPCVRAEKRRPRRPRGNARVYQGTQLVRTDSEGNEIPSPKKEQMPSLVEKPSIASTSSFQFGEEKMIRVQRGVFSRPSLEDSCLVGEGEDTSHSFCAVPVFSRPTRANRSRSSTTSTCTTSSESSAGDTTPPLSPGPSSAGGSMSSIDLFELNNMLANANPTNPVSSLAAARNRARTGTGHRRRYSKAQRMSISRGSIYETIEEESNASSSEADTPDRSLTASLTKKLAAASNEESTAVYVVESDTQSIQSLSLDQDEQSWDDERGIVALRKFYTLKDEAHDTVQESQRVWPDTPFSVYALQSFAPPRHPDAMKAMLEHSVRTYGPLPAELRRIRSRKDSRPSPYPQTRVFTSMPTAPPMPPPAMPTPPTFTAKTSSAPTPVLQERKINKNILGASPAPNKPVLDAIKPFSPFVVHVGGDDSPVPDMKKMSTGSGNGSFVRPRVPSAVRRSALGWTKRSNGAKASTDKKENKENAVGQGLVSTPGDNLRINRPRPRGRTPGSQARPIRV